MLLVSAKSFARFCMSFLINDRPFIINYVSYREIKRPVGPLDISINTIRRIDGEFRIYAISCGESIKRT